MKRNYTYRVVSNNGAGEYGGDWRSLPTAKEAAIRAHRAFPRTEFEVERVETTPSGGHRYWMRQGKRWVPWDASRDASVRKPDFLLPAIEPTK